MLLKGQPEIGAAPVSRSAEGEEEDDDDEADPYANPSQNPFNFIKATP